MGNEASIIHAKGKASSLRQEKESEVDLERGIEEAWSEDTAKAKKNTKIFATAKSSKNTKKARDQAVRVPEDLPCLISDRSLSCKEILASKESQPLRKRDQGEEERIDSKTSTSSFSALSAEAAKVFRGKKKKTPPVKQTRVTICLDLDVESAYEEDAVNTQATCETRKQENSSKEGAPRQKEEEDFKVRPPRWLNLREVEALREAELQEQLAQAQAEKERKRIRRLKRERAAREAQKAAERQRAAEAEALLQAEISRKEQEEKAAKDEALEKRRQQDEAVRLGRERQEAFEAQELEKELLELQAQLDSAAAASAAVAAASAAATRQTSDTSADSWHAYYDNISNNKNTNIKNNSSNNNINNNNNNNNNSNNNNKNAKKTKKRQSNTVNADSMKAAARRGSFSVLPEGVKTSAPWEPKLLADIGTWQEFWQECSQDETMSQSLDLDIGSIIADARERFFEHEDMKALEDMKKAILERHREDPCYSSKKAKEVQTSLQLLGITN